MHDIQKVILLARQDRIKALEFIEQFALFDKFPFYNLVCALILFRQNEKKVLSHFRKIYRKKYLLREYEKDVASFLKEVKRNIPLANREINNNFNYIRDRKERLEDAKAETDKVVL